MSTVQASTRSNRIPLSEPCLQGNEWAYLKECLDSGWVSSAGPFVERFERAVAEYTGAPHAVAVVNATCGLHLALQLVGVEPDDEVLVSNLTFIAPVNAIRYCGAHPVFVDADQASWQFDAEKAQQFLRHECQLTGDTCYNRRTKRRVRAILPVHILGLSCDMGAVVELASRYHLRVVEDAAEGMGVRYQGRHVGTFGDVAVLSFNGNKIITTGGGGMILTRDATLAVRARYLTTQAKSDETEYLHDDIGYNYRLTNLQAAVGLAQLEQLNGFLQRKRAIARTYAEAFAEYDGLSLMPAPAQTEPTYWLYTILLLQGTTLQQRQTTIQQLRAQGIQARPLWCPIHRLKPYRDCQHTDIRWATDLHERAISLPSSTGLTDDDLGQCVRAVKQVLAR